MSFFVEPSALDRAASRMTEASADAQAAKAYITKHTDMPWHGQGLLNEAWPAHQKLVDEMTRRLTHLVQLLNTSPMPCNAQRATTGTPTPASTPPTPPSTAARTRCPGMPGTRIYR
ncbi:hypothetical protein [Micromonospora endolithica]|uniref:hypothetical protein n=1 Tax=Micromonospora endolithica TaxID=230091 RepID=UPI0011BEE9A8|nr:hypothetical protein [Micromonospora endolithica]